jgi:hypothetical protein
MLERLMLDQVVGSFAGVGDASLCSVVTNATGVTQALIERSLSKTIFYNHSHFSAVSPDFHPI